MKMNTEQFSAENIEARNALLRTVIFRQIVCNKCVPDGIGIWHDIAHDAEANIRRAVLHWNIPAYDQLDIRYRCAEKTLSAGFAFLLAAKTRVHHAEILVGGMVDAAAFRINATSRSKVWAMIGVNPNTGRDMLARPPRQFDPNMLQKLHQLTFTAANT